MNRKGKAVCALLLVQFLAWGAFVPTADAKGLVRLSAQFRRFDGSEDLTSAVPSITPGAGGVQVYTKSFSIPTPKTSGQQPVVFITMTGQAEQSAGGIFVEFTCTVDSSFCNGGSNVSAAAGWVTLMTGLDASVQIHGVHYTWCAKVNPGTHTATVRMASSNGTSVVSLHNAHFFIDRTELKASTADDCELGLP